VASADYASFVITKTRDVCFTGSLVEHQLSMLRAYLGWPLDINGSKLSFYRNIFFFLSQCRVQKYLVCISPYGDAF